MNQVKILKAQINELYANRSQDFINLYLDFVSFFNDFFKNQAQEYINNLEQIKKTQSSLDDLEKLFAKVFSLWMKEWEEETALDLLRIWVKPLELDLLDNSFEVQYAKENAWKLIKWINETTQKEMAKLISDWIEKSLPINEIGKSIKEKFSSYSLYRSTLIANQEVSMAYEQGKKRNFEAMSKNMGVTWFKRSVTQHDDWVRETHKINEKDWWITANKVFSWTWTDTAPHWIWCRCYVTRSLTNPVTGKLYDNTIIEYSDEQVDNFNYNFWNLDDSLKLSDKEIKLKNDFKLRNEEIMAIKSYTAESSSIFSEWYKKDNLNSNFVAWIPFLIWGLNKLKKFDWITYSWRKHTTKADFKYYANLKVWDSFMLNEFISSSQNKKVAEKFLNENYKLLFKIKSTKWIDIEDLSLKPTEREVLFLPKTLYYIEKIEFIDNMLTITLIDLE